MDSSFDLGESSKEVNRIHNACNRCQMKKMRCDGETPTCSRCKTNIAECIYSPRRLRGKGTKKGNLSSIESRLETLESLLEPAKPPLKEMIVIASQSETGMGYFDNSLDQYSSPGVGTGPTKQCSRVQSSSDVLDPFAQPATTCHNAQHTSQNHLEIVEESKSTETFQKFLSRFPVFNIPVNRLRDSRGTISDSMSSSQLFIPMLPKSEALPLIDAFFDEFNAMFPIFDKSSFMEICQNRFPVDSESEGPALWACLNTIIALATRLKATNRAFRFVSEISWSFFKNAFSVYPELIATESSVLSIQAILAMVIFLSGTTDTKTMAVLISTASRMIHMMSLHHEHPEANLDPAEADERRRVFWATYLIDRSTNINSGLPFTIEDESLEVTLPGVENFPFSNKTKSMTVFGFRIQLAIIESKVKKHTLDRSPLRIFGQNSLDQVLQFHHELESWKKNISLDVQPNYDTDAVAGTRYPSVLMLHLEFYNCVRFIHRAVIHQLSQMQFKGLLEASTRSLYQSQLASSTAICAQVSRATLRLVQHMGSLPFADLWWALQYPLCAVITLLAGVIENPASIHSPSDVIIIGDFVRFLKKMKEEEDCDLERFLAGCSVLENIARTAVVATPNYFQDQRSVRTGSCRSNEPSFFVAVEAIQDLKSKLTGSPDYMLLTQGLMGNIPTLNSATSIIFSRVFENLEKEATAFYSFGPESLTPGTYDFGLATSIERTMKGLVVHGWRVTRKLLAGRIAAL